MDTLAKYLAKPDKTIAEHTQDLLENLRILEQLGYISDQRVYRLTEQACLIHDWGKMNSAFQKRIKNIGNSMLPKKWDIMYYHFTWLIRINLIN